MDLVFIIAQVYPHAITSQSTNILWHLLLKEGVVLNFSFGSSDKVKKRNRLSPVSQMVLRWFYCRLSGQETLFSSSLNFHPNQLQ
jgi:hypothetical protein